MSVFRQKKPKLFKEERGELNAGIAFPAAELHFCTSKKLREAVSGNTSLGGKYTYYYEGCTAILEFKIIISEKPSIIQNPWRRKITK